MREHSPAPDGAHSGREFSSKPLNLRHPSTEVGEHLRRPESPKQFYESLSRTIADQIRASRTISEDPTLGESAEALVKLLLGRSVESSFAVPGPTGAETFMGDDFTYNAVGSAIRTAADALIHEPQNAGRSVMLFNGENASQMQALAINTELERIFDAQPVSETPDDLPSAISGLSLHYEPIQSDPSRYKLELRFGASEEQELGGYNSTALVYADLLSYLPGPRQTRPGDSTANTELLRSRAEMLLKHSDKYPESAVEDDRTGELAQTLATTMHHISDFIGGRPGLQPLAYALIYEGGDPESDPAPELIRQQVSILLGAKAPVGEPMVSQFENGEIATQTMPTDMTGIDLQFQSATRNQAVGGHAAGRSVRMLLQRRPKQD